MNATRGTAWALLVVLAAGCNESNGPNTGAIRITVTTTGAELDGNGYSIALDGSTGQAIPVNDTITLAGLSAGSHHVLLSGLAVNCAVAANPRPVQVVGGATAQVAFSVTCVATPGRILFVSERSGGIQIHVMNADGSAQVQFTSDSLGALDPNWSPDGTMFVYSSIRGITDPVFLRGYYAIVVKNADGSGARTLVNLDDTFEPAPAWSPDGSKIALSSYGGSGYDIFVKDVSGSSLTQLTTTAGATDRFPSWSPDGARIAFVSDRDGNEEIYVMNADGSGQTRLTTDPGVDYAPTWSPDGSQIAFHSDRSGTLQVYVMNADGSGLTRLTNDPTGAGYPNWGR